MMLVCIFNQLDGSGIGWARSESISNNDKFNSQANGEFLSYIAEYDNSLSQEWYNGGYHEERW